MEYLVMVNVKIFILVHMFVDTATGKELVLGNLIWRHGDRSSSFSYPNDPYKNVWKRGPYQLTEEGMAQEYSLGIYLRGKYGHLLSDVYDHNEILIKATDTDRTKMSAQCVVAGMYSPQSYNEWKSKTTPWIPFPLHTTEYPRDWLFQLQQNPEKGCPNSKVVLKNAHDSSEKLSGIMKTYSKIFKNVQLHTGREDAYDMATILHIYDNLFCLQAHGYQLPHWVDDNLMATLEYLAGISIGIRFTDIEERYSKTLSKMRNGVILENMIDNMQERIKGKTSYAFIGYSAHDSSVTPLLVSLGAYNWILPPYASCVMIDLYRDHGSEYFVEFWYRNDSSRDPYPISFYDCGHSCSFDKFLEVASSVVTDSSTPSLCGYFDQSSNFNLLYILFSCLAMLVLIILMRRKRRFC